MSDDSKELADAGTFGLRAEFHAHPAVGKEEMASLVEGLLMAVGKRVTEEKGMLLGHVKAFVTAPDGTLKVNLIDMDLGTDTLNRLSSPVEKGELKFMAALVGLDDEEVEDIMEDCLEALEDRLGLEIEEHEHDHGHDHDHEHH
ncbi:MAG: hypothetical protein ISF22_03820 [Methanomassiliicoccus sp.]|nr:hypothetical protein [Methanomassiliicoccus sp.]